MGDLGTFAVTAAVICVLALVAKFIRQHFEKKRTEELQMIAQSMGLEFGTHTPLYAQNLLFTLNLPLFNQGRSKTIYNLMYGSDGATESMVFDYKYTTGSGKKQQTAHFTIALMRSPQLDLPSFTLRPERFGDRILSAFGRQDIDFSDHPELSRSYLLRGPEEAVRAVFHEHVLTWFQGQPGLLVQGDDQDLIVLRSKPGRIRVGEVRELFEQSFQLFSLMRQRRPSAVPCLVN